MKASQEAVSVTLSDSWQLYGVYRQQGFKKNWYKYIFCELEWLQRADSLKIAVESVLLLLHLVAEPVKINHSKQNHLVEKNILTVY